MTKYGGYCGKILRINLSSGKITKEDLSDSLLRKFLGGNGLGISYLFNEVKKGVDPLSEENKILIFTGPLNGTVFPSTSKIGVFTKSPLTNGFTDSYAGGHFAAELKFAGYDGIIIEGKSEKPVYIYIHNENIEIRDASKIWGKINSDTKSEILNELNDHQVRVASIGPSGEKLVNYANINFDGTHWAGRGGNGSVMGSKKLKAIAVRGTGCNINIADKEKFEQLITDYYKKIKENKTLSEVLSKYGTTTATRANNSMGILGTRNWQTEVFKGIEGISAEAIDEKLYEKALACFSCPIRCMHYSEIKEGPYIGTRNIGPQYETVYSLGSLCCNSNSNIIAKGNEICNEMGIDTISTGVSIAFLMECFEKGLLKEEDLDGLSLNFGNEESFIKMVEKISQNEGIGKFAAKGVKIMSEEIGKGSEKFAIHMKGYELAGHSVRGYKGMSLGYATSPRGGSHQDMRHLPERSGEFDRTNCEGKAKLVFDVNSTTAIRDSFTYCTMIEGVVGRVGIDSKHVDLINAVTGIGYTVEELQKVSERIYNLERCFNVREGKDRKDDTLPSRFMNEPIPEGPSKGMVTTKKELDTMLDEYYQIRGWNTNGIPTKEKLDSLDLQEAAKEVL
ncbi:MAG: aldehyde ferredoxin oxidoreductase family protein [Eubacteriaceae bacterium]